MGIDVMDPSKVHVFEKDRAVDEERWCAGLRTRPRIFSIKNAAILLLAYVFVEWFFKFFILR